MRRALVEEFKGKKLHKALEEKVHRTVDQTLRRYAWTPELNKHTVRTKIRSAITSVGYFGQGLNVMAEQIRTKENVDPVHFGTIKAAVNQILDAQEETKRQEKERIEQEKREAEELEKTRLEQEAELKWKKLQLERIRKIQALKRQEAQLKLEAERQQAEKLEREGLRRLKYSGNPEGNLPAAESSDDESPIFEALHLASPPRVTRKEIEEKFSREMREELQRLAIATEESSSGCQAETSTADSSTKEGKPS